MLLVAVAAVAFANSLAGVFVFDDDEAIVGNPYIRAPWPLNSALSAPSQSAVSGRPLVGLSLALNYAVGGLDPTGYHIWNIAVHLGVASLLYGVLRRTFWSADLGADFQRSANGLAMACALLWLVHPLNSEVVDYTVLRTESMMAFCYLLTLYAAIRGFAAKRNAALWLAVSVVSCLAGAGCKESIVTAPIMVLLYDAVFEAGSLRDALRHRGWYYPGLAVSWAALVALNIDGPRSGAGFASDVSSWTYLMHQGPMIATYLQLAVWPVPLVADYGSTPTVLPASALPWFVAVAALVGSVAVTWRKSPGVAYLGTWFFVTLSPASSVIPIATEVGAERRMYLPLAALVVLAVVGARALIVRFASPRRHRVVSLGAAVLVSGALTAITVARHSDFHDRLVFWQSVVDRRPHGRAHHNLGIELSARHRPAEAIEHYRQATAHEPKAHYALAYALAATGRSVEAAAEARQLLTRLPNDALAPEAARLLGVVLAQQGDHTGAVDAFAQALAMRPSDAAALAGVADSLRNSGRMREAADAYRAYLVTTPNDAVAFGNLGAVLSAAGRIDEAIAAFARGVELAPASADARLNYGLSLLDAGRQNEALDEFRRGLAIDPRHLPLNAAIADLTRNGRPQP